ncbi:hypothetical protein [Actinotignum schaalii]|uniref:(d)CMP kinase n=1 Tax=Actinotignum schaalii FB123-CNA-2 TaxID=883067 RepID=S2VKH5_9ACTO|nr:hypothetical protein [Actinotignum schaalii]EPD26500.1 hypothetical protein HMPREF9237_01123 [Actinotignum schaalii FB123-CNA-2]
MNGGTDGLGLLAALVLRGKGRRIYGIDGRSGAGKTQLSRALGARLRASGLAVEILEVEHFVPGWDGLARGVERVAREILEPFLRGENARVKPWNWYLSCYDAPVTVPADQLTEVLLLEGCGSASAACAPLCTATIWMECEDSLRRARVREREGDPSGWWDMWAAQERVLLAKRDAPALAYAVASWDAGQLHVEMRSH